MVSDEYFVRKTICQRQPTPQWKIYLRRKPTLMLFSGPFCTHLSSDHVQRSKHLSALTGTWFLQAYAVDNYLRTSENAERKKMLLSALVIIWNDWQRRVKLYTVSHLLSRLPFYVFNRHLIMKLQDRVGFLNSTHHLYFSK